MFQNSNFSIRRPHRVTLAKDILSKKAIDQTAFSTALALSLIVGRHKEYNILICGPGDCGKTYILKSILKILPLVFKNLVNSWFAWLKADTSNLIFLNDL